MYNYDVQILEDELQFCAYNDDSELIGILQVQPEPDQYVIEGLYVEPEYRNEGIATVLMDTFLDGIPNLKLLPCTCTFSETDAGDDLVSFFQNREDFFLIEAGKSCYVRNSELFNSPVIAKIIEKGPYPHIKSLKDLEMKHLNGLLIELKEFSLDTVSNSKDLLTYYDPELSSVYINEHGVISAVLVSDVKDGNAFIETVFFKDSGMAGMEAAVEVIRKIEELDEDMTLSFFAINERSEHLLENLIMDAWSADEFTTYLASWTMVKPL